MYLHAVVVAILRVRRRRLLSLPPSWSRTCAGVMVHPRVRHGGAFAGKAALESTAQQEPIGVQLVEGEEFGRPRSRRHDR